MKTLSGTNFQLKKAVQLATSGQQAQARGILRAMVALEPTNYQAWLWLAYAAETVEEKRAALFHALELNEKPTVRQEFQKTYHPDHILDAASYGAFMCYSRTDELFAVEFAEHLKRRSLPVWIDMLDVPEDADWNEAVTDALEASGVVLVVLSPNLLRNEEAHAEIDYSLRRGKIVLPVLYRDCNWEPLHLPHSPIDFRKNPASALRMIYALLGILNSRSR